MAITFYYAPQSNATRVHWTLEELGVPYEKVKLDLRAGDQRKPEFLAINPNGKVPTVVIDGTPMFESIAIQIALGERFGVEKGLWPAFGSPEHFQALSWIVWGQVSLGASIMRYMFNTNEYIPKEQHNEKAAEAALKDVHTQLAILNDRLNGREFVVGDRFNIADLDLASVLGWGSYVAKLDLSAYPNIATWMGRANGRPAHAKLMANET